MISAIVLAAGRSRRMGTQKLLLPWRGKALIAHVVDELLRGPVDELLVVVGRDAGPILEALAGRPVRPVATAADGGEMLDSVRCGLRAVDEQSAAAIVALGDQPGITAQIVAELVRAFHEKGRGIVVPTHQGRRGHPLLFAMRYRGEILTGFEDRGLRGLLAAQPVDVCEVEVATPGVLEDVDLPEDYRRIIASDACDRPGRSSPDR